VCNAHKAVNPSSEQAQIQRQELEFLPHEKHYHPTALLLKGAYYSIYCALLKEK
jgi:hypothetical protein